MWALALLLAGLPLKEEPRPGGDPKVALAQITMGRGAVKVTAGASIFDARIGFVVGAGDVVTVPAEGWVTLALTNGHVVRLDDELTIKVESLAMLKAPRQTRSYKAQLDELVTPSEQEGMKRVAGWHVSMTAANVPGEDLDEGDADQGGGSKKVAEEEKKPELKRAPISGGPKQTTNTPSKPGAPPPPASTQPTPTPAPVVVPPPFAIDQTLQACVEGHLGSLGPAVRAAAKPGLKIRARTTEGRVQIVFGVGLATPPCVAAWVALRELKPEWQLVDVPLK